VALPLLNECRGALDMRACSQAASYDVSNQVERKELERKGSITIKNERKLLLITTFQELAIG